MTSADTQVRGGVSVYRIDENSSASIATSIPLVPLAFGKTAGIFNNIYPLPAPDALSPAPGSVQTWLGIVNLDSVERKFRVISALSPEPVVIPPRGRKDVPVYGITFSRYGSAGTVTVQPYDSDAQYIAHISGYGSGVTAAGIRAEYLNSNYLRVPFGGKQYLPIERRAGVLGIVAIHSTSGTLSAVSVKFYGRSGVLKFQREDLIYGLLHYPVDASLDVGEIGYAVVSSLTGKTPIIAESVSYFIDSGLNLVTASDSTSARAYFPSAFSGGYNLFLGMRNYLRVINPGTTEYSGTHTVGSLPSSPLVVGAGLSGLYELFSPSLVDTYGSIGISATPVTGVFGDVVRAQPTANGGVNFMLSSPLQ